MFPSSVSATALLTSKPPQVTHILGVVISTKRSLITSTKSSESSIAKTCVNLTIMLRTSVCAESANR